MPREIGKLTPEQLAKEREARAAREEIFRRICVEVEATGSTFEQAASQLGAPHHVIRYFQADYENARVKESLASRRLRAAWDFLKPAVSVVVLLVATDIISSDYSGSPERELAWLALVVILVAWRKRLGSFAMRFADIMKSDWGGRCSLQRRLADPWFGHIGSTSLSIRGENNFDCRRRGPDR